MTPLAGVRCPLNASHECTSGQGERRRNIVTRRVIGVPLDEPDADPCIIILDHAQRARDAAKQRPRASFSTENGPSFTWARSRPDIKTADSLHLVTLVDTTGIERFRIAQFVKPKTVTDDGRRSAPRPTVMHLLSTWTLPWEREAPPLES